MVNKRITIFDKSLSVKMHLNARTETIELDILERSYTKFTAHYTTDQTIIVDSDFLHDNETNFFGIITKVSVDNDVVQLECTNNQYIFNSDIILPGKEQFGATGVIKDYIQNFLNGYLTNPFLEARLPITIDNQVPEELTFTLPDETRSVNFANWFNRYVRLYNLRLTTELISGLNRSIKVSIVILPLAENLNIDDLRNYIISSDFKLYNSIKNIINVIDKFNINNKISFYLKVDGTLTTNPNDADILSGVNQTTLVLSEYTIEAAQEEAEKVVQNTFKNEIKLTVIKTFFDSIQLNQKITFITKNRLQITSRLTKKVSDNGIYTLTFGDERNNLTSRIAKKFKEVEDADL